MYEPAYAKYVEPVKRRKHLSTPYTPVRNLQELNTVSQKHRRQGRCHDDVVLPGKSYDAGRLRPSDAQDENVGEYEASPADCGYCEHDPAAG